MALENIKLSVREKQEEKIKIFKLKKENKEEFLSQYNSYCKILLMHPKNPWRKKSNPIYNIKSLGINKIGKTQSKIIYFLYDFFRKGKPVYFSYKNIAEKLDINQTNISKVLQSLVDKELIFKENFKNKNGGGEHQVLILPNIPYLKSNFQNFLDQKLLEQNQESYLNVQVDLFCKHSKNKDFFNHFSLRTFKAYIRTITTSINKDFSLKTKRDSGFARNLAEKSFSLKTKERKNMGRLQLKMKQDFLSSKEASPQNKKIKEIKKKFSKRKKPLDKEKNLCYLKENFDSLKDKQKNKQYIGLKEKNKLNYFLVNEYGFEYDIKNLLNINNLDSIAGIIDNKILFTFFDLLYKDGKLEDFKTIKIINHYNSKNKEGNKKFSTTKINKNTKVFKKINILVSHLLLKYSLNDIRRAIDRFDKHSSRTCFWKSNKISILNFLVNQNDDIYLKVFLEEEDDRDIFSSLIVSKTNYEKAQNAWRKMFISFFYDEEQGKKYYKRYKYNLVKFLEFLINQINDKKVKTYGYNLLSPRKNKPPILKLYVDYLRDNVIFGQKSVNVMELTNPVHWNNFLDDKMREEFELSDFFFNKNNKKDIDNDFE